MFTATLIASGKLVRGDISSGLDALRQADCRPGGSSWLDEGSAADLWFDGDAVIARTALEALPVDVVVQPSLGRAKKLLVADMDSTMITVECIDELADYAGLKDRIAAVTEAAMRGELDFAEALDARVALLKDLEASAIERCRAERVRIMPGAKALVRTMKAHGARTVLVSGGFTVFAEPVAAEIGFDVAMANRLGIAGDRLDGSVDRPIVDASTKLATIEAERVHLGLEVAETLAVGDGANDIPMIQAAGLGVAYRAKPRTAAAASARIEHGDLTTLLWAQGYARKDWQEN
jgi:phosphoserine phosphatase